MKKGNISNMSGVTFGFKCEDFLITESTSFSGRLLSSVGIHDYTFDETALKIVEHIFRNTEYTVDLIVDRINYKGKLKSVLDDIPFSRIVLLNYPFMDKPSQISSRLLVGDLSYFVDNDDYRRSLVNSKYAINLSQVRDILRR